jgi:AraC-like DNA-binding protein
MAQSKVVSIKAALSIAACAERYGLRAPDLLAAAGIAAETAADPEGRATHGQVRNLWREAASRSGDPDFGLHMAEWLQPEDHIGLLAYACRSSPTLGESYRRVTRYFALLHQQVTVSLIEAGAEVHLTAHPNQELGPQLRHPPECMLATLLLHGRRGLGQDLRPLLVRFAHQAPADTTEHARIFGAPVRFGAEVHEMVLPRAVLDQPLHNGDARLAALLDRQAEAQLAQLTPPGGLMDAVHAAVAALLEQGEPALDRVAARVHRSARSLQRHLLEEGTSFRGVVDQVRRDLALRHLAEQRLAIGEIAFLLGFSEVSAFHRAFRRWTGRTPASYRG